MIALTVLPQTAAGQQAMAGAAAVVAVRMAVAAADARACTGRWPLHRCGGAAAGLLAHDALAGLVAAAAVLLPMQRLLPGPLGTALGAVLAVAGTGWWLGRRQGLPLAGLGRAGALARDPVPTVRDRLLTAVRQAATRDASRWIAARLDGSRRRASVTDDQLLPAVWAPARIRLRTAAGLGRTEVALILQQAQGIVEDGAPARERLLTLLHLVLDRAGRRGVRSALDQGGRVASRHAPAVPVWTPPGDAFPTLGPPEHRTLRS